MSVKDPDTQLGGIRRPFPSTCWSRFAGRPSTGGPGQDEAAEYLARHYWKPVYAYIRAKWAKTNEDAKDLAQEFFAWMMETGFLSKADPARGRFRAWVKVALENFLSGDERKRQALKRGGERPIIRLDAMTDGDGRGPVLPDPAGQTPEEALDREWKNRLFARAVEALEEALKKEGKELYFALFNEYYLEDSGDADYKRVASRHDISPVDMDNYLRHAKRLFGDILTNLVAETVEGEMDLDGEMRALFDGGWR